MLDFGGISTAAELTLLIILWFALFIGAALIITLMFMGLNDLDLASRRFRRSVERLMESIGMNKLGGPMPTKLDERKERKQTH
jgi:hypothetical protein